MLKTKIICTLGPAVDDPAVMRELIAGGMDVARMNFSHGTHREHGDRLRRFRALCREMNAPIPVLLDTRGPEVRLGEFPQGEVHLQTGQDFLLTTRPIDGTAEGAFVNYEGLPEDVSPGDALMLDDGLVRLTVLRVEGPDIHCRVENDGEISAHKGVNAPDSVLKLPVLTETDRADLLFAVQHDYNFIAVSFVQRGQDILDIRQLLDHHGGQHIKIIAKVESRSGVQNLDEIIDAADGIMIARGDLGVEMPVEELPRVQKDMTRRCYRAGKPVITATQMLDSMIRNPRPTRAEITDVANAIYDGTSALMLSGETAIGQYPCEALATMRKIAKATESAIDYWHNFTATTLPRSGETTLAIGHAACTIAMDLQAAAIVAVTTTGETARCVSAFRPSCPILVVTFNEHTLYQLRLSWGVLPLMSERAHTTDELFAQTLAVAKDSGLVQPGQTVVVTAGVPLGQSGGTNMLKIHRIGDALL